MLFKPSDTLEIVFDSPLAVYQPGDTVTGQVLVDNKRDLKMRGVKLKFNGRAHVHWKDSKGKSGRMVYFRSEENYFEHDIDLYGQGKLVDVILPKGSHSFPFQLPLPTTLPSSFEGSQGHVRYVAMAIVDLPMKVDYVTKCAFTVLSQLDLNDEPTLLKKSAHGSAESAISCCCLAHGSISAEFNLNKTGFVPGESIVINGRVQNDTNLVIGQTKVSLNQCVEYFGVPDAMFSSKEPKSTLSGESVCSIDKGTVLAGSTQTWTDVALEIPAIPPSRLAGCNIINISYMLEQANKLIGLGRVDNRAELITLAAKLYVYF